MNGGRDMAHITSSGRMAVWAQDHPVALFFGLAYLLSWALWIPAGLVLPAQVAHFAGPFGPLVAALIVVGLRGGSAWA